MYFIQLSNNRWLGTGGFAAGYVKFNSRQMKGYKTLAAARKACIKGQSMGWPDPQVYTIDWSQPHCPITKVM